jgi:hypothetical protein
MGRSILIATAMALASVGVARGEPPTSGIELVGPEGSLTLSSVSIRWKTTHYTRYAPELTILLENASDEIKSVRFDWIARVCSETSLRLTPRSARFIGDLLGPLLPRRRILAGGWAVISFPLGLDFEPQEAEFGECEVHIRVIVHSSGGFEEEAWIVAPAPTPTK